MESTADGHMIVISGLSMSYALGDRRIDVLSDIDLGIGEGETVAVLGPSGSGKTTLLVLLAGLEKPRSGSITVGGEDITSKDADWLADLRRDRLGIVFQSFHLIPSLTAIDNVAAPLQIAGIGNARDRAGDLLARVGLSDRQAHFPDQLSGGEQQRVAIARALVHSPSVVLADEPTGNLDGDTGAGIIELLFELNAASGSTMILVTHDVEVAGRCQRTLHLRQGRLVET